MLKALGVPRQSNSQSATLSFPQLMYSLAATVRTAHNVNIIQTEKVVGAKLVGLLKLEVNPSGGVAAG